MSNNSGRAVQAYQLSPGVLHTMQDRILPDLRKALEYMQKSCEGKDVEIFCSSAKTSRVYPMTVYIVGGVGDINEIDTLCKHFWPYSPQTRGLPEQAKNLASIGHVIANKLT
jgi:hypothetical protein